MPLTPKNRKEEWLEGLVEHETTLTPKNRCESWMKEIIDASGSGGGGGGGVLVCTMDMQTSTLDKTWSEIYNATFPVIKLSPAENTANIAYIGFIDGEFTHTIFAYALSENGISQVKFTAETADSYPVIDMG